VPARQRISRTADPSGPAAGLLSPEPDALPVRGRIQVRGVIDRITVAPVSASPSFTARARIERNGARHSIRIIWMGQRRVPGIEAGVELRFEGMVSRVEGTPTVYNPRYEIIGRPEEN